jgi:centromere-localized protein 2
MAPSESEVLTNYLLQPSKLTSIITFPQFQALFPAAVADKPALRTLFHDIRLQRDAILGEVAANIEAEVIRGNVMRKEVLRVRRGAVSAAVEDVDGEIELERAVCFTLLNCFSLCCQALARRFVADFACAQLFSKDSGAKKAKHTLSSIVTEIDGATGALETEIRKLQDEEAQLSESIRQTIGALSDLRYGKFANSQVRTEILEGISSLQESCKSKSLT